MENEYKIPQYGEQKNHINGSLKENELEESINNGINQQEVEQNVENTIEKEEGTLPKNIEPYREPLEKDDFYLINGKLHKWTGKKYKPISNFLPIVEVRTKVTNGIDTNTTYRIKPIIIETGQELPAIEVNKKEFASFKFVTTADWGWEAIAEKGCYDELRIVAQILAKDSCEDRQEFTCTGFKEIEDTGETVYLYDGGAITKNGDSTEIKADLSEGNLKKYCFTYKKYNLIDALKNCYSILKMGKLEVMIILIAYTFLTPLTTFLEKINFPFHFCLFLKGRSGTGKSESAAIMNSFWGTDFTSTGFGISLDDSENKLGKHFYILKDALVVPDDLNPRRDKQKEKIVLNIIFSYGNRQGRGRMSSNRKIEEGYYPRGTAILTGEYLPSNAPESTLARCLVIQFDKQTLNLDVLEEIKLNKEHLAFVMKDYIHWLIIKEDFIEDMAREFKKENICPNDKNIHGRTKEIVNVLNFGVHLFTEYMKENEIIQEDEKIQLENDAKEILIQTAYKQVRVLQENDSVELFYDAVEEMINTDKFYLVNYNTGLPMKTDSKGKFLGYLDEKKKYYYFSPTDIYAEVKAFYKRAGEIFPINKNYLWDIMAEQGLIYMTSKDRTTVERVDPRTKEKRTVVAIKIRERKEETLESDGAYENKNDETNTNENFEKTENTEKITSQEAKGQVQKETPNVTEYKVVYNVPETLYGNINSNIKNENDNVQGTDTMKDKNTKPNNNGKLRGGLF